MHQCKHHCVRPPSFLNVVCSVCWLSAFAEPIVLPVKQLECPKWLQQLPPFSYLMYLSCHTHNTHIRTHAGARSRAGKRPSIYKSTYVFSLLFGFRREIQCICTLRIIFHFIALRIFGLHFPDDIYFDVRWMQFGIWHPVRVRDGLIFAAAGTPVFFF